MSSDTISQGVDLPDGKGSVSSGPKKAVASSEAEADPADVNDDDDHNDDDDGDEKEASEAPEPVVSSSTSTSSLKSRLRVKSVQDKDPANWMPHCYVSMETTRPSHLEPLLTHIAPVAFSAWQLRGVKDQCKKESKNYQATLGEILEYCTNFDRSAPLVGNLRHLPSLKSHLAEKACELQQRANSLQFPISW